MTGPVQIHTRRGQGTVVASPIPKEFRANTELILKTRAYCEMAASGLLLFTVVTASSVARGRPVRY
jgi:hypothetical protein